MDAQVKMWNVGIREGTLFVEELYDDGRYPHWWLDKVLPKDSVAWFKEFDEFRKRAEEVLNRKGLTWRAGSRSTSTRTT